MTFSQEVKNEICNAHYSCANCKKSTLYGMLMCCRGVTEDSITLNIENKTVVDFFVFNIIDFTGAIVEVKSPQIGDFKSRLFTISIRDKTDVTNIIRFFLGDISKKHVINYDRFENDCCKIAFLRGVYLICGSIINPQTEYHFEFSLSSKRLCNNVSMLLSEINFDFKTIERGNSFILYLKESNKIEEILTLLGAVQATFELINLKIEKEMRNNVNRQTNCETANIGKTVNASLTQLDKIKRIHDTIGFDALTPELQEIALLRLLNPDASLRDLCELNGNKISKSGLNHRLQRLSKIAEEIYSIGADI